MTCGHRYGLIGGWCEPAAPLPVYTLFLLILVTRAGIASRVGMWALLRLCGCVRADEFGYGQARQQEPILKSDEAFDHTD